MFTVPITIMVLLALEYGKMNQIPDLKYVWSTMPQEGS